MADKPEMTSVTILLTVEMRERLMARQMLTGRTLSEMTRNAWELYLMFPPDFQPDDPRREEQAGLASAQLLYSIRGNS